MKIIIITQNEPFFLAENIKYFLDKLSKKHEIVGVCISEVSPFGKKENFLQKTIKTLNIFGFRFFIFYSIKFFYAIIFKRSIRGVLNLFQIPEIKIKGSINSNLNLELIKSHKPDLIISILANQIFKKPLIDLAPKGCINLHTALLPEYRGLIPTFWVLKNNELYTGVSVFFVDEGIDSGPIILQEKVEIGQKTQQQLIKETKLIGMNLILKSIDLIDNNKVQLIENPESKKSYYSFPTREDVKEFKRIGKSFF